ncbi:unnamed protein product [Ectocarpus sp. CCAP 1310/34]|nr:unnamed protein product [Ectocarpus sp. CCAP 1310/34]
MGWKLGQGLGAKGDGITVPVVLGTQVATLGLGKSAEDDRYTDEAARERKKLDSEVVETADMKAKRLEKAVRQETIKEQVQVRNHKTRIDAPMSPFPCHGRQQRLLRHSMEETWANMH